jgi:hypothetical protein
MVCTTTLPEEVKLIIAPDTRPICPPEHGETTQLKEENIINRRRMRYRTWEAY